MLKSDELKAKLVEIKAAADKLEKAEDIKNSIENIQNLKAQIELVEMQEADEAKEVQNKIDNKKVEDNKMEVTNKTKENANAIRAMIKKTLGKHLTDVENALLIPASGTGENGEGYILPEEVTTLITKLVRQYKSLSSVLGTMPVSTLTGSFPVENFDTVSELVDFADGTPIDDITDIKFKNVSFSLKEKAGFIALSNTLLGMTDNDLIAYVAEIFAKKKVATENKMGLATLKSNKTAKSIADWKALKKSINKDLDPATKANLVIVTNQDGFDTLDSALDSEGRPVLQPDPTQPTRMLFMGYPVEVFSNTLMPTVSTKAPIFYGDLKDTVKFATNGQYAFATDKSVGFLKNVTVARIIAYLDCIQVDSSDKGYVYGEFTISE